MNETTAPQLNRIRLTGIFIGAVGLLAAVLLGIISGFDQFYQGYLMAYIFWFGLGMGCLGILMIQHLTGGGWGFISRRLLEAGALTIIPLAVGFIVILLGMYSSGFGGDLYYRWLSPDYYLGDHAVEWKRDIGYLTSSAFVIRALIFFTIWIGLAFLLRQWSIAQDTAPNGDFSNALRLRRLSAIGMVLYVVTMTAAPVDWAMSLEPHFFSTMYGVLFMVGQGLETFAFLILMFALISSVPPFDEVVTPNRVHDLGKLMLAFVILWTYVNFGQYVIIWSGNLPEFTPWYINRTGEGWQILAVSLALGQFALPFFLLLSRKLKRDLRLLWGIAAFILIMRMVDIFWLIAPDLEDNAPIFDPIYIAALVGLGGIWIFFFTQFLMRQPLLPQNDLRNDTRAAWRGTAYHG